MTALTRTTLLSAPPSPRFIMSKFQKLTSGMGFSTCAEAALVVTLLRAREADGATTAVRGAATARAVTGNALVIRAALDNIFFFPSFYKKKEE